jgi:hypothetical protein
MINKKNIFFIIVSIVMPLSNLVFGINEVNDTVKDGTIDKKNSNDALFFQGMLVTAEKYSAPARIN